MDVDDVGAPHLAPDRGQQARGEERERDAEAILEPAQARTRTVRTPSLVAGASPTVPALLTTATRQPRASSPAGLGGDDGLEAADVGQHVVRDVQHPRRATGRHWFNIVTREYDLRNRRGTAAVERDVSREGWYRRVVPVTTLVVAVLAALAILVPGVRDQLALSATTSGRAYVALAFPRTQAGTVITCAQLPGGPGAGVRVGFDVTSHLEGARDLVRAHPGRPAAHRHGDHRPRRHHADRAHPRPAQGRTCRSRSSCRGRPRDHAHCTGSPVAIRPVTPAHHDPAHHDPAIIRPITIRGGASWVAVVTPRFPPDRGRRAVRRVGDPDAAPPVTR